MRTRPFRDCELYCQIPEVFISFLQTPLARYNLYMKFSSVIATTFGLRFIFCFRYVSYSPGTKCLEQATLILDEDKAILL